MQIRKALLGFRTLLRSMELFKKEVIPTAEELNTWMYKEDMKKLTTRYILLTQDKAFQAKLEELYLLETVMTQIRCLNDIEPVFFKATPVTDTYVKVRGTFLMDGDNYQIARSIGKETEYPMNIRSMSEDPRMMTMAKRILGNEMKNRLSLNLYKFRYDVANRKDA